jgi:hypothetical protein
MDKQELRKIIREEVNRAILWDPIFGPVQLHIHVTKEEWTKQEIANLQIFQLEKAVLSRLSQILDEPPADQPAA